MRSEVKRREREGEGGRRRGLRLLGVVEARITSRTKERSRGQEQERREGPVGGISNEVSKQELSKG